MNQNDRKKPVHKQWKDKWQVAHLKFITAQIKIRGSSKPGLNARWVGVTWVVIPLTLHASKLNQTYLIQTYVEKGVIVKIVQNSEFYGIRNLQFY